MSSHTIVLKGLKPKRTTPAPHVKRVERDRFTVLVYGISNPYRVATRFNTPSMDTVRRWAAKHSTVRFLVVDRTLRTTCMKNLRKGA